MNRVVVSVTLAAVLFLGCGSGKPVNLLPADYASWEEATKVELNYPIPGHENHYRISRVNATGFSYRPIVSSGVATYDYPEGTIFAKEVYAGMGDPKPGEKPVQITFAVKAPKDPRSRAGWLWVAKDGATGNEEVVTGSFCVDCHANANEKHPYGDGNPRQEFRDSIYFPPALRDARVESPSK